MPPRPFVLWVGGDRDLTLGWWSCYGSEKAATKAVDKLFKDTAKTPLTVWRVKLTGPGVVRYWERDLETSKAAYKETK